MLAFLVYQPWTVNNLPYSEYWLPLGIGLAIGFTFLVVAKSIHGRRADVMPQPPPPPSPAKDYDPFVHGSPSDSRKSFRRAGNPVEVLYALPDNKSQPMMGWVFDRSVGGLGLVTSIELAEGTILLVRPTKAPDIVPWIEVEVRSCRSARGGREFELGCKFVKTPQWSILLMFG